MSDHDYRSPIFSILIPTWNNLSYLKTCVNSIQRNSFFDHQIILHINDGADGTLLWAKQNKIEFTYSNQNIGICRAINRAFKQARAKLIVYMNDDMYACPNWDKQLWAETNSLDTDCYLLSSTMIEPTDSGNPCVIHKDFGQSLDTFQEKKLLAEFNKLAKANWSGSSWPPLLIHRKYWEQIGGFSEEFSPGYYSDPDLAMKMWQAGCRIFKGIGSSKVYHFQAKSTGRVEKNDGRKQFLHKWGILPSVFYKYYLKMGKSYSGPANQSFEQNPSFQIQRLRGKLLKSVTNI